MALYKGTNLIAGMEENNYRCVGQLVPSMLPLTDSGLHLLDGALLSGTGVYSQFVTYIAGLQTNYPNLFETEANWQAAVSAYGVCGKFVYDSVNNTVRLPKITGIIEGTTDTTALGDLVEAGLPNITGEFRSSNQVGFRDGANITGAFKLEGAAVNNFPSSTNSYTGQPITFDASRSSSKYGNSSTVQPQTIKCFYYIVVATTTKTAIESDIDQIASDLNLKAGTDLSNLNATGKKNAAVMSLPSSNYTDLTLGASGATYTMPDDGWLVCACSGASSYMELVNYINGDAAAGTIVSSTASYIGGWARASIPVKKGDTVNVYYGGTFTVRLFKFVYAVGTTS